MSIDLMAPNGAFIAGTAEAASGYSALSYLAKGEDGTLDWDFSGSTEGFYDGQTTITFGPGGPQLFEDDEGNWWSEHRLVPLDATPDPTAKPCVPVGTHPTIPEAIGLRILLRAVLAVPQAAPWLAMAQAPDGAKYGEEGLFQAIQAALKASGGEG